MSSVGSEMGIRDSGDILTYAFAESEGPANWQALHYFLMRRCSSMGHRALHDVVDGYDDLGSMNQKDPSKHWFATILPHVKRAPRNEPFHGL